MSDSVKIMDPIHGVVNIESDFNDILSHKHFNRLRYISQLGTIQFIFPSATHSRYSHSIGTFHLAKLFFDKIEKDEAFISKKPKPDQLREIKKCFLAAALLHDVGHSPLSHSLANWLRTKPYQMKETNLFKQAEGSDTICKYWNDIRDKKICHEFISSCVITSILQHSDIDTDCVLYLLSENLASTTYHRNTASLFDNLFKDSRTGKNFAIFLNSLLTGSFDVDMLDYLSRDAFFTGVKTSIDMDIILKSFSLSIDSDDIFTIDYPESKRAIISGTFMTRHIMYSQVYFHTKNIYLEKLICESLSDNDLFGKDFKDVSISEYCRTLDSSTFEQFQSSESISQALHGYYFLRDVTHIDTTDSRHINASENSLKRKFKSIDSNKFVLTIDGECFDHDWISYFGTKDAYRCVKLRAA